MSSFGSPPAPTSCSRTSARARSSAGVPGRTSSGRVNPGLVIARVTGFGQTGPYASRPGFGTLAEAMSGFAALNGEPDGPPLLPPLALADGVDRLRDRLLDHGRAPRARAHRARPDRRHLADRAVDDAARSAGRGLGPARELQPRTGNRSSHNAPRNVYATADGGWVAVSASATSIAERVLRLVGRDDLVEQPWFATGSGRVAHVDEIDGAVADWIAARSRAEVLAAFEAADAAIAPIYDARDILADPHFHAIGTIVSVDDEQLGAVKMPGMISRLSATPGEIRSTGGAHGADTDAVLSELGLTTETRSRRCAPRGRYERSAADLALRPRRPARPGREGDRLPGACRHRRSRGRRRAVGEGAGPGEPALRLLGSRREKPVFVRVNAGSAADLEAIAELQIDGVFLPKVDAPDDIPAERPAKVGRCTR